jgi:tetratricopeptide (TPR) repeat protein
VSANKILRGHTALLKPLSPESFAEAIGYFERALAHDPGSVAAKASLAGTLAGRVLEGMTETRAADLERAEANMYNRIGIAYLLQSRTDEAIVWLEKAREANPTRSFPYAGLASAHALEGDIERASAELADALPARASFALQPIDEVDDGVEAAPGPAADAGPRNSYGQMRLAVAGRRRHRPASSMPCSEILAPQLPQGVT